MVTGTELPHRGVGGVTLRLAEVGDVLRLIEVELDAGEMFRTVGLDSIADGTPDGPGALQPHIEDGTAWVAELDGNVIGYALASIVDGQAHLRQVSVLRAAQGIGVGRSLIEQVERWGRKQRLRSITLTTFADVPWNAPYYVRLGYSPMAEGELSPGLAAIRTAEVAGGLDLRPRIAMRKRLGTEDAAT